MKNIYLIGDSIRTGTETSPGYERFIRERCKDGVYSPNDSARFAQYTLRGLSDWVRQIDGKTIDGVHWNNGLWDVLRLDGDDPLTPIDMYVSMLERIYKKLRLFFPNAEIIFALTTPVIEKDAPNGWMRYNRDIQRYNEAAAALMNRLGVKVNDLYSVAESFDESDYDDWTHFNERGARILAQKVIQTCGLDK